MSVGGYLSTVGHVGLIGFVLFGPGFDADPLPMEDIQQVSVISEAQFAALLAPEPSPVVPVEPAALTPPEAPAPEPDLPEPTPEPTPAPEAQPEPPAPPPEPDAIPEPPVSEPEPEVAEEIVIPLAPTAPEAIAAPLSDTRPNPRPAPRVAPEPIAPPEPDAQVADEVQEAAQPAEEANVIAEEEQEATSPEEATTETVTEAEEEAPSGAVTASLRPQARPTRPQPAAESAPEAPTEETAEDPLAAALTEALQTDPAPTQPAGPPMTSGERDALRVAVSQCWNVGSLSTEALSTIVVVGVDMNADGTPNNGSVRLISSSGGSAQAAQQAFEAARRAIIRCGARGFDLPREKYDQWREIEMTFNPEQMRIR